MFCSKCGGNLQEGTVFCPSCGTKVSGGAGPAQEVPKPAAQDNVESGIPLSASPDVLHKKLVSLMCEAPNLPLDFFDKAEVIREERYCVPAYCFHCNGTESFNYEVANERSQVVVRNNGEKSWEETRKHKEWTPSSGNASVRQTVFSSGNRKMAPHIEKLYAYFDPKKLVGVGELAFPADVNTLNSDLPQTAAFNEFAAPRIEQELKKKAREIISKQNTTGLSMGGANIQKEIVRVFLGLYHIIFKYDGKEYSVWMTGDGQNAYHEGMPEDTQRKRILEEKVKNIPAEEKWYDSHKFLKTGLLTFGMVMCIIFGVIFIAPFVAGIMYISRDPTAIIAILLMPLSVTGAILIGIRRSKKKRKYYAEQKEWEEASRIPRERCLKDIEDFKQELPNTIQRFKSQKKALRGIYESVSGNASAF